ncbi:amino acid adenylation domain-containing protein [Streptomyces sp. NBC_00237]|uniref:non-ribosomal peptide synthetase n=1 Tax=Streptomyces sp. NBC_00237 TaxID=2975687 RepID=UPI002254E560|nr:amino acid adenylation domain-containing protein [Streptomyces sp. NBC_00237]MCX5206817.1 amino acid adenylation domain-containing protein [Streptomyces sp. NBC_00237]
MTATHSSTSGARTPQDRYQKFPLTEIQYAYWVGRGSNFVLGNVAPHAYFELEGRRLDPDVLSRAWRHLIERHDMLRAVVGEDGQQRVLEKVPEFRVRCTDLRSAPEDEAERTLQEIRDEMSHHVYTAADWPLFDIRLTRLPGHDRLHVSLDLLMVDLASLTLLFSEWSALCQDPGLQLPPVDVTFRDYALALERGSQAPRHQKALEYWTSRATALAPPPDLPLAKSPVSVHKPRFTHREFHLPEEAWKRLQDRCEEHGLTPTAVLATVFSEVLAAWSGTRRFTLNLTLFNRLPLILAQNDRGKRIVHPHLRRMVGDFTSICLLEMDASTGRTLDARVEATQAQLQKDLRHRQVSALQTLRERRRLGLQSGFETMPVVFTSGLGTAADVSGSMDYFGDITYRVSQTPQVWLDHQVIDITGSLDLTWDCVEELFPAGLLDDMFAAYCGLVARLADDETMWGEELAVTLPAHQLTGRERHNATEGERPTGLLHEPFLDRAAADPDRPAVLTTTRAVTYGELAARAHAVSTAVGARLGAAVPEDHLVGITLDKGPDQVAAAYGVLMSGGAYLPVNAALPAQRRARILQDGRALAAVTDAALDTALAWPDGIPRVLTDRLPAVPGGAVRHPSGPAAPQDLAYVIYTSGSTGAPKGVMIEHHAALNTVVDINERFGIGPDDRVFGLADLGFDLSVYDLFGTLAAGAALVLPDPDLRSEPAHWAKTMGQHGVSVWNSVPAQMQMLVEHLEAGGEIPERLRLVLLSGDWIPVDLPGRIHALWPEAEIVSLGGATEASIWSIHHRVDEVPQGAKSVPYGTPLRNQTFHVLDAGLAPCPVWTAGELYIGGVGLARGYWADEERTGASFVTHPRTGERLYRTGDFGRYTDDGTIEFLGRRDGQVKINGHRVELGEIETTLTRHPGVDAAVVVKSQGAGGAALLYGYVVPAKDDDTLFVTEHADPDVSRGQWQALCSTAGRPAEGPAPEELRLAWDALNDVYLTATAAAFRALGLPYAEGDAFDPAALRGTGVAPRYERWLARAVEALTAHGHLRATAGGLEVARELPAGLPAELGARVRTVLGDVLEIPEDVSDWMLSLAGDLAGVLTQSIHSAELYASDRTPGVYARLFGPTYAAATDAVREMVRQWPADRPLKVMEVGGGYGSLTQHLLPLLPADRTEYVFTDISRYFMDKAQTAFADHPFVRYDLFDLDQPPATQGFENQAADLVVAASVLHDMRQIRRTLHSLRSVLAPGGVLLMVEQTTFHPWFDLVMGLQQGFDSFEDTDLRTGHCLLDRDQWRRELTAAGFTDAAVLTTTGGPSSVGFDVIVAQGPQARRRFAPDELRTFAAAHLARHMVPAQLLALDELPLSGTGKVDRAALAKAGARGATRGRPARPPRTDRQLKLVGIWQEVLGLSSVDLADDFLEMGGDSLLAARLAASLQSAFDVAVPVGTLLQYTTVEALDGHLETLLGRSELMPEEK